MSKSSLVSTIEWNISACQAAIFNAEREVKSLKERIALEKRDLEYFMEVLEKLNNIELKPVHNPDREEKFTNFKVV